MAISSCKDHFNLPKNNSGNVVLAKAPVSCKHTGVCFTGGVSIAIHTRPRFCDTSAMTRGQAGACNYMVVRDRCRAAVATAGPGSPVRGPPLCAQLVTLC